MASRARFLAPLTLAALSAVAALSLARVVDSDRFVAPVLGAALLPHAIGAVARRTRRPVAVTVGATAVGLGLFVLWALLGSTTTLGIPGPATWQALGHQLRGGWHLLRTTPAPAPTTDGAILLSVLAVWCMAAIADWVAFRRQATLAAIAPALVFFVWTSALGTAESRVALTAGFCVAAGAFVVTQNVAVLEGRRSWLVSQQPGRPHWILPAAALGAGAIVVALLVAPVLPGAGSGPLLDFANRGNQSGGRSYQPLVAPFVDIGGKLDQADDVEVFTVKAAIPDYWRIAALDRYSTADGGQWTISAEGGDSVTVGLPTDAPPNSFVQQFHITKLRERWLPAAYRPVAISLPDTLVVTSSGTIVTDAPSVANLDYTVASKLAPLGDSVDHAQQAATAGSVPAALKPYTDLPSGADYDAIAREARQVTAGATNPYEQARALRDYFRDPASGFVYDTTIDPADSGSAIVAFLRDKHGFCVQFASAYAAMARSLGIPARVAVGFTPGTRDTAGVFHVTSHDAHAWPEIWLAGLGWTHMFDPTPAASGVTTGGSNVPDEPAVAPGAASTPATTVPPTTVVPGGGGAGSSGQPGRTAAGAGDSAGGTTAATTVPATGEAPRPHVTTASTRADRGPWLIVAGIALVIVFVVLAYATAVLTAKSRRRRRRREATDPVLAVTGAWHEALERLREADCAPDPALTPLELAHLVPLRTATITEPPLRRLARSYTAARYSDVAVGPEAARDAWTSVDELEQALTHDLPWHRRWRRKLDPTTLR